ncbi:hypothetical protein MBANPS3_004702 [Mucor bainieri]
MIPDRETFIFYTVNIIIVLIRHLIPWRAFFRALINRGAQVLPRQDAFEKIPPTALAEKNKNNKPASTSDSTSTASPLSPSSSYVSAASSPKSNSPHESLPKTTQPVRKQSNAALSHLSGKIDDLKQENQDLKAHITTIQGQLVEDEKASRTMATQIDMLKRHTKGLDRQSNLTKEQAQQKAANTALDSDAVKSKSNAFDANTETLIKRVGYLGQECKELRVIVKDLSDTDSLLLELIGRLISTRGGENGESIVGEPDTDKKASRNTT